MHLRIISGRVRQAPSHAGYTVDMEVELDGVLYLGSVLLHRELGAMHSEHLLVMPEVIREMAAFAAMRALEQWMEMN